MSIRKRDVHFSDWTKVRHALVCNNVQGITETSSFDDVRAFLINSESGSNPFYYYVCYIKETKEIYTHGQFYDCLKSGDSVIPEKIEELESTLGTKVDLTVFEELQSDVKENELVTARALTELNEKKADSVDLNAIKAEIEENEKVAAKALMDLNERKLDKSELDNIDLSNYVDLDTYYNNLNTTNSSINLKADKKTVDLLQTTVNLKANQSDLDTLSAEVEENEDVTAAALTELHENKADKTDLEDYAKKDDLNTKQDQLVSGTTIKTVNGNSILGSGNIETPDTKVTSAENHYGYNSDNATSTTGAFVTKITKDAANHVTSFESRALTSTDIPGLDASKITTGEISIDRLPKGALERLFVVESEAAAISATVQEGDVVQVTGNSNKMYFCISNTATTFATKFKEFTAGTATSVPWSGITGKPTGIDGWGDRIGVIESGYATQSWVGENYLSKSGGKLVYSGAQGLEAERTDGAPSHIMFIGVVNGTTRQLGGFGMNGYNDPVYVNPNGIRYKVLTAENYSSYALPITGGTMTGNITLQNNKSIIQNQSSTSNYTVALKWLQDGVSEATSDPQIGHYNIGDTNGAIVLLPYSTDAEVWNGNDGLYIGSSNLKFNGTKVSLDGHTHSYLPTTGATHSGMFTIDSAGDLTLKASASTPDDPGDLVFANSSGAELARIYYLPSTSKTVMRYGPSTTSYEILTSNTGALKSHTHNWSDINNTITASNEFNFVYEGFNSSLWVNYRSKTNTNVTIKEYHFGNGSGGLAPCYATNFIISSDKRLKTNIKEIYNAAKSLELGFYEFDYKNGGHSAGHVAQDVREVLPAFVHGKESETEYLSVDYTGLHSMQIKALIDEINSLKKENEELKKSNKEIHTRVEKIEEMLVMLKES